MPQNTCRFWEGFLCPLQEGLCLLWGLYEQLLLLLLSRFSRVQLCATHRQQPARPRHSWDSPDKNTGVGCHFLLQSMKVKSENEVAQSCPTLRDPMDCSLPGSSIHRIFQARVLEWGAIAFSSMSRQKAYSHGSKRACPALLEAV